MPRAQRNHTLASVGTAASFTTHQVPPTHHPQAVTVDPNTLTLLAAGAAENTLAAFDACLSLQFGMEFDVDRTRDGVLVCMHDGTVDRTTDGTGRTGDMTLAELKQLDCGSWFDPAFAGARVPTIAEVLALAGRQPTPAGVEPPLLAVDIKAGEEGGALERELVQLALGHGVLEQCLFIGRAITDATCREHLRAASPLAQIACLASSPDELDTALLDTPSNWVYLRFVPSESDMARCRAAGKCVFVVGLTAARAAGTTEEEIWASAAALGVDGFLSDNPLGLPK